MAFGNSFEMQKEHNINIDEEYLKQRKLEHQLFIKKLRQIDIDCVDITEDSFNTNDDNRTYDNNINKMQYLTEYYDYLYRFENEIGSLETDYNFEF